jgi:hypothetical protein
MVHRVTLGVRDPAHGQTSEKDKSRGSSGSFHRVFLCLKHTLSSGSVHAVNTRPRALKASLGREIWMEIGHLTGQPLDLAPARVIGRTEKKPRCIHRDFPLQSRDADYSAFSSAISSPVS